MSDASDPAHPFLDNSFEHLPPVIQKKCFSTLERLRIEKARTASTASNVITATSKSRPQPSRPGLARSNSSYFRSPSSSRSRKNNSPITDSFTHIDAQWYQHLPAKIQRKNYTREEQIFLAAQHPPNVIADAADLAVLSRSYCQTSASSVQTLDTQSFKTATSRRSSISTFEAVDDMDDSMLDSLSCFDMEDELDLALDDYHSFFISEPAKKSKSKHQPSFRKVMSLSSIPLQATQQPPLPTIVPATATPTPQKATTPILPSFPPHLPNFSRPQNVQTHKHTPSTTTLDASATHYQDPSTRLKLRVYLGSPQKFDEAIEFGFPSTEDVETLPLSRPSLSKYRQHVTAPPRSNVAGKTFLDDSNPSIFDALDISDDEDETQSLPERGSPYTPQGSQFAETYLLSPSVTSQYSPPPPPPLPSTLHHREQIPLHSKPTIRHDPSEPLAQVLAGNREMTLRMTLTRPDLRADEKDLYRGHNSAEDPLALEHLPPMSEKGGDIWDTLPPVKESGLRKIWRKVSGKGY